MKPYFLSYFSWRGRLTPGEFLRQSLLPAALFLLAQHFAAVYLSVFPLHGPAFLLATLLHAALFIFAVASSPLALPGCLMVNGLLPAAPQASGPAALVMMMLGFPLMLLCGLHLAALAARRQRDAGQPSMRVQGLGLLFFVACAVLLGVLFLFWRMHAGEHPLVAVVISAPFALWFIVQCCLLFRPSQASPDSCHA